MRYMRLNYSKIRQRRNDAIVYLDEWDCQGCQMMTEEDEINGKRQVEDYSYTETKQLMSVGMENNTKGHCNKNVCNIKIYIFK